MARIELTVRNTHGYDVLYIGNIYMDVVGSATRNV